MTQQKTANALPLIGIGNHERYFRSVAADQNVAAAAGDCLASAIVHHGNRSNVLLEADLNELGRLLFGKGRPH
jgi:hypothetical protein